MGEISEQMITEKNWIKAYKIHSKMENASGNKIWKWRHPLAGIMATGIAASIASKDYGSLAMNIGSAAGLASNHIQHIRQVKKELDHRDQRHVERQEHEKHMAKWNADRAAEKAVRDKRNKRRRELYAAKKK